MASDNEAALDDRLLHRMLFFTDAVFAIVMTLLVLELRAPESPREANAETLRHLAPHIAAFAFSFAICAVLWSAHLATTRRLARFDWPTAWANLLFLLPVCLLPSATAWLGAGLPGGFAFAVYCWVLIGISTANVILVLVAFRPGGRVVVGGALPGERRYRALRAASPGIAFAIGLAALAAGLTIPAYFCSLLIPLVIAGAQALKPRDQAARPEPELV